MKLGIQMFMTRYVKVFVILTCLCPPFSAILNFLNSWARTQYLLPGFIPFLDFVMQAWLLMEISIVIGLFGSLFFALIRAFRYRNNDTVDRWGP